MSRTLALALLPWIVSLSGTTRSACGDDSSAGEPPPITVRDCRMAFVDRRTLGAERLGLIEVVPEEGTLISMQEVVLQLHDEVAEAAWALAVHQAQSGIAVEVAQKAAEGARFEFDVAQAANAETPSGRIPPVPFAELTRLRLAAESAELEVTLARYEQETLRFARDQSLAELETYRVLSPVNGIVTRVYRRAGEPVQQGEPVLEVVNTTTIRIEGAVSLEESLLISAGHPVRVTIGHPLFTDEGDRPVVPGVLGFVDVTVVQSLQEVRVWADITNTGDWKAGMPCEMEILTPSLAETAHEGR